MGLDWRETNHRERIRIFLECQVSFKVSIHPCWPFQIEVLVLKILRERLISLYNLNQLSENGSINWEESSDSQPEVLICTSGALFSVIQATYMRIPNEDRWCPYFFQIVHLLLWLTAHNFFFFERKLTAYNKTVEKERQQ